jgi:hypothetical protein
MQLILPAIILALFYFIWPLLIGPALAILFDLNTSVAFVITPIIAIAVATATLLTGTWSMAFFIALVLCGAIALVNMSFL